VFYLFTKILIQKNIAVDLKPENIYSKKTDDNTDKVLDGYCKVLEKSIENNYTILEKKKFFLDKTIKISILSFVLYILLITTYKVQTMDTNESGKPENEKIEFEMQILKDNEEKKGKLLNESDTTLTEKDFILIRQIVREELDKIEQERNDNNTKEHLDKINKKSKHNTK
jgi:hypothetical protein